MNRHQWPRLLAFGLLAVIIFSVGKTVWPVRAQFFQRYDPRYWQERYERSQWARGFAATELMGDADLYSYAGWRQIKGDDPTRLNPEQPPLGKYLLGWSILFFGNPLWLSIIVGPACLGLVYLMAKLVLKKTVASLAVVSLLAADGLFLENLTTTMLDLPFLFFTLVTFYSFLRSFRKQNWYLYLLTMGGLAGMAGTKMYLVGFGLLGALSLFVLFWAVLKKEKKHLNFFLFLPFFAFFYLLIFSRYFAAGYSLADFKYYHFWVRHFARVRVSGYPSGEIWRIFLTGRWLTWWPENTGFHLTRFENWSILWPAGFVAFLAAGGAFLKKKAVEQGVLLVWVASFLAMFSFGVPYPRYLLPVLPPIYLLLVRQVLRGVKKTCRL